MRTKHGAVRCITCCRVYKECVLARKNKEKIICFCTRQIVYRYRLSGPYDQIVYQDAGCRTTGPDRLSGLLVHSYYLPALSTDLVGIILAASAYANLHLPHLLAPLILGNYLSNGKFLHIHKFDVAHPVLGRWPASGITKITNSSSLWGMVIPPSHPLDSRYHSGSRYSGNSGR